MAKIQARNVDDELYQRIEQSAMKHERSLEGEIRIALREYYAPKIKETVPFTLRESWQKQTGERLQWLIGRLLDDGYFGWHRKGQIAGIPEFVRVADQLGSNPGLLMDISEGRREMVSDLARELAKCYSASSDWLLTGDGSPFAVTRMGALGYHEFFLPAEGGNYTFELLRISRGRHEGTLIVLRICADTGHTVFGVVTECFNLGGGMGATGHGRLKEFLLFLKTKCAHLAKNTYDFSPPEPDFDFWSVIGQHHPVWYQDANQRTTARWLQQIYSGVDPADWFNGWSADLQEIADASFGGDE